jgi:DNA invertase Pin-like site-specific DNA recombinase
MLIGYARVSSTGQDHATQLDRLKTHGCQKIYEEKLSGLDKDRPQLARALDKVREGDVLVVTKLDRLARSASHLHQIVDHLTTEGAGLRVLDDSGIDTTTRSGKLLFGILASFAEFETALRKERQMEGIAKAKAEGRTGGRPKTVDEDAIRRLREEGLTAAQITKQTGTSRAAVYRALAPQAAGSVAIARTGSV